MISVAFHNQQSGPDRPVQVLTWDGRNYSLDPADPDQLQDLLARRIKDPDSRRVVTAREPEAWMRCLQWMYRSAYFWADPPDVTAEVQPT